MQHNTFSLYTEWNVKLIRKGVILQQLLGHNAVMNQGAVWLLGKAFCGLGVDTSWYVFLYGNQGGINIPNRLFVYTNLADIEITGYGEGRKPFIPTIDAEERTAKHENIRFIMTAENSVYGGGLVSNATVGNFEDSSENIMFCMCQFDTENNTPLNAKAEDIIDISLTVIVDTYTIEDLAGM